MTESRPFVVNRIGRHERESLAQVVSRFPERGTPDEIAVSLRTGTAFVTGTVLAIDGGFMAQ